MRDQRGPAITYPPCYDPELQCTHTIRLGGAIYRCGRFSHDQGIHDSDGFLVRW